MTGDVDDDKIKMIQRNLNEQMGPDGDRVIVLGNGQSIADRRTAEDVGFVESQEALRKAIFSAQHVSRALVGDQDSMTYGGLAASLLASTVLSIQPDMDLIADEDTRDLSKEYGESLTIEYEIPSIKDPELEDKRLDSDSEKGVMTVREYRVARGWQPFGDERDDMMMTKDGPVTLEQFLGGGAPKEGPAPKPKSKIPANALGKFPPMVKGFSMDTSDFAPLIGVEFSKTICDLSDEDRYVVSPSAIEGIELLKSCGFRVGVIASDLNPKVLEIAEGLGCELNASEKPLCIWDREAMGASGLDRMRDLREFVGRIPQCEAKEKLRSLLGGREYGYVRADIPQPIEKMIKQIQEQVKPEHLDVGGIPEVPHVTVLWGLMGCDYSEVAEACRRFGRFNIAIQDVTTFPEGRKGVPVKLDVHSPAIEAMNRKLRSMFPHVETHDEYRPHITIAYVKPEFASQYTGRSIASDTSCDILELKVIPKNGATTTVPLRALPHLDPIEDARAQDVEIDAVRVQKGFSRKNVDPRSLNRRKKSKFKKKKQRSPTRVLLEKQAERIMELKGKMMLKEFQQMLTAAFGLAGNAVAQVKDETKRVKVAGLAVMAEDSGRLLMLQRTMSEVDPAAGYWEFPGGHIEEGESALDAAKREWQEETGHVVPDGRWVAKWESGIYRGHVWLVPSEDHIKLNLDPANRHVLNPDDPDGDWAEVVAWWTPEQLAGNTAVREELRKDVSKVIEAINVAKASRDPVSMARRELYKEWKSELHPRGDDGRFIEKGEIDEAAHDPEKQDELFGRVSDPKEKKILAKAIEEAGGEVMASPDVYPSDPKEKAKGKVRFRVPDGAPKISPAKLKELDSKIASVVGDDPQAIADFRPVVFDAWKMKTQEVAEKNEAIVDITGTSWKMVGQSGEGSPQALAALVRKARQGTIDPAQQRAFDEMVDSAQKNYPHLIGGDDPETELVDLLSNGIQKLPDVTSDEVGMLAIEMAGPIGNYGSDESGDSVPFSVRARSEGFGRWQFGKAFDPNQPRGDDGKWIDTGRIKDAANDAGKQREMFASVSDPKERQKLRNAIEANGGKVQEGVESQAAKPTGYANALAHSPSLLLRNKMARASSKEDRAKFQEELAKRGHGGTVATIKDHSALTYEPQETHEGVREFWKKHGVEADFEVHPEDGDPSSWTVKDANQASARMVELIKAYPGVDVRSIGLNSAIDRRQRDGIARYFASQMAAAEGGSPESYMEAAIKKVASMPPPKGKADPNNPDHDSYGASVMAMAFHDDGTIVLNSRAQSLYESNQNAEFLRAADLATGEMDNVAHSMDDVINHEFGHLLTNRYALDEDYEIWQLEKQASESGMAKELSLYAGTNTHEFVSEAFAESFKPDARPMGQLVRAVIDKVASQQRKIQKSFLHSVIVKEFSTDVPKTISGSPILTNVIQAAAKNPEAIELLQAQVRAEDRDELDKRLIEEGASIVPQEGTWIPKWKQGAKAEDFAQAFTNNGKAGYMIEPQDCEGYDLILSEDGMVGAGVSSTGDIRFIFVGNDIESAADVLMEEAINRGGMVFGCLDGYLPIFAHKHGFREITRLKFEPEMMGDWDIAVYGEPDYVFMALTAENSDDSDSSGDSTATYADSFEHGSKAAHDAANAAALGESIAEIANDPGVESSNEAGEGVGAFLGRELTKGFDPNQPRGDDGRWIDTGRIPEIAGRIVLEAKLRSMVTNPNERRKLDALIMQARGQDRRIAYHINDITIAPKSPSGQVLNVISAKKYLARRLKVVNDFLASGKKNQALKYAVHGVEELVEQKVDPQHFKELIDHAVNLQGKAGLFGGKDGQDQVAAPPISTQPTKPILPTRMSKAKLIGASEGTYEFWEHLPADVRATVARKAADDWANGFDVMEQGDAESFHFDHANRFGRYVARDWLKEEEMMSFDRSAAVRKVMKHLKLRSVQRFNKQLENPNSPEYDMLSMEAKRWANDRLTSGDKNAIKEHAYLHFDKFAEGVDRMGYAKKLNAIPEFQDPLVGEFCKAFNVKKEQIVGLVGAPDDSEVKLRTYGDGYVLMVRHPQISTCERVFKVDADGKKYIKNSMFFMNEKDKDTGLGTTMFSEQAANASAAGFDRIETYGAKSSNNKRWELWKPEEQAKMKEAHDKAGLAPVDNQSLVEWAVKKRIVKSDGMIGYFVWPRLGYDATLDELAGYKADMIRTKFPQAKSLADVMESQEGRDWWFENGDGTNYTFDLKEGSRSIDRLSGYLSERDKRKK